MLWIKDFAAWNCWSFTLQPWFFLGFLISNVSLQDWDWAEACLSESLVKAGSLLESPPISSPDISEPLWQRRGPGLALWAVSEGFPFHPEFQPHPPIIWVFHWASSKSTFLESDEDCSHPVESLTGGLWPKKRAFQWGGRWVVHDRAAVTGQKSYFYVMLLHEKGQSCVMYHVNNGCSSWCQNFPHAS